MSADQSLPIFTHATLKDAIDRFGLCMVAFRPDWFGLYLVLKSEQNVVCVNCRLM